MKVSNTISGAGFNQRRAEIFGVATLLILIGHSQNFLGILPLGLSSLIGYGGIGVTMFAFLSGIGLWQSMENNSNLVHFYTRRLKRVVVPYLIIASITYFERDILYLKNISRFFEDITCFSFWTDGRGAWYVAWIVPIYLFYPAYYKLGKLFGNKKFVLTVLMLILLTFTTIMLEKFSYDTVLRLQSPIGATIAFIIGDACGEFTKSDNKRIVYLSLIGIVFAPFYLFDVVSGQTIYTWFFAVCGIAVCGFSAIFTNWMNSPKLLQALSNCGGASLEIYLFNLFYIGLAERWLSGYMNSLHGIWIYIVVAALTVFSGLVFKMLSQRIVTIKNWAKA